MINPDVFNTPTPVPHGYVGSQVSPDLSASTFSIGATQTQVPLSAIDTDANGALVEGAPAAVWASEDETIISLKDQGDGTVVATRVAATGGTVTVTATVTNADGTTAVGSLVLTVAAAGGVGGSVGNVTSVEIVPGIAS